MLRFEPGKQKMMQRLHVMCIFVFFEERVSDGHITGRSVRPVSTGFIFGVIPTFVERM
jgi:hypothetical protein